MSDIAAQIKKSAIGITQNTTEGRKETPVARAERAYENIRQTVNINEELKKMGILSEKFALKKTFGR